MEKEEKTKDVQSNELQDFPIDVKRDIIDIINDTPSLVRLGNKEYRVKDLRFYSLNRICRLALAMKQADETLDDDNKVITALCTDLDAMSEIMAIILCNHLFRPDDIKDYEDVDEVLSRNDKWIRVMKMKVMKKT